MGTPHVPFLGLEVLWFQSGGTLCNLRCTHCFISCSPDNHNFALMTRADVRRALDDVRGKGVKEIYHTGGEPFINREMPEILDDCLELADTTVLTNATLIKPDLAARLAQIRDSHPGRSLQFRISLESWDADKNDEIRGEGVFDRALLGAKYLSDEGFRPIFTMMRWWDSKNDDALHIQKFEDLVHARAILNGRVKILPSLRLGAEAERSRGYRSDERLTEACVENYDFRNLQCSTCRMVTNKGVYVCPILLDFPEARMGGKLEETFRPFPLKFQACYTCRVAGLCCGNTV